MNEPLVGIIMGSRSDLESGRKAAEALESLGIPFEITVSSAHRTPADSANYAKNAKSRGLRVIIAVAGLAAALPGVIAAHTTLPVIGVPVSAGTLGGLEALLSIAQMPPGVPVAAMGIDSARNAALFAARIIALSDERIHENLWNDTAAGMQKVAASRSELAGLPVAPESAFEAK
ncbi:MAG: 5-(carboxyamino)imidazole ribonucleotide mutase [Thermovirgaceae bacterium]|nr:5-(carboxyamino)imidazole ribonucleotide mutase [Thermovirgaceae bacterium]